MLRGRGQQCGALDGLLVDVRAGRSRVLVVRGEPGIGKTALLDYAIQSASGFRVARAAGVESEMELAFAALHQLCAPMLDRLERLPGPQHDAVGVAFGLSAGNAPDRFLIGLAVLSLLSEVGEERPLLCLVDDAQWMDRASAQTLAFVARRLLICAAVTKKAGRSDASFRRIGRAPRQPGGSREGIPQRMLGVPVTTDPSAPPAASSFLNAAGPMGG